MVHLSGQKDLGSGECDITQVRHGSCHIRNSYIESQALHGPVQLCALVLSSLDFSSGPLTKPH